jgi:hypothetical protein
MRFIVTTLLVASAVSHAAPADAGAGLGTFAGIKVVRYSHGHTNNFVDRWLLGTDVTRLPDGRMAVGWGVTP